MSKRSIWQYTRLSYYTLCTYSIIQGFLLNVCFSAYAFLYMHVLPMRWWIKIDIISHYAISPCNRTHCYAELAVSSPSPVLVLEMTYYVSSGTSDPTHCMYSRLGWVAFWRNFPALEIYVGTVLRQKLITAIVPPKPDGLSIRRGGCILRHIIYLQRGGGNYWLNDVTVTWACFYNTSVRVTAYIGSRIEHFMNTFIRQRMAADECIQSIIQKTDRGQKYIKVQVTPIQEKIQ